MRKELHLRKQSSPTQSETTAASTQTNIAPLDLNSWPDDLASAVARKFDVCCQQGPAGPRIVTPIHDWGGRIVARAESPIRNASIPGKPLQFKLMEAGRQADRRQRVDTSVLLYNAHRVVQPARDLIVVQSIPAVWWLWGHGYPNGVALMGPTCGMGQSQHVINLVQPEGTVWIMTDGDQSGWQCARHTLELVSPFRRCRWVRLVDRCQPMDLSGEDLAEHLWRTA